MPRTGDRVWVVARDGRRIVAEVIEVVKRLDVHIAGVWVFFPGPETCAIVRENETERRS